MKEMRKNKMENVNEIKNNFVKWYNNDCYEYHKVTNCDTFQDCYDDIEDDDYETIIEEFADFFGYNVTDTYKFFSENHE